VVLRLHVRHAVAPDWSLGKNNAFRCAWHSRDPARVSNGGPSGYPAPSAGAAWAARRASSAWPARRMAAVGAVRAVISST
jgi:hypothetical protein